MIPLLLLFAIPSQSVPPKFVAARDHGQKTAVEWTAELGRTKRPSLAAIWSVYYSDARTPETIEALQTALKETGTPAAVRALDTVVNQWRIPCEVPSAEDYSYLGDNFIAADALFPAPLAATATAASTGEPPATPRANVERAVAALLANDRAAAALDTLIRLDLERGLDQIHDPDAEASIERACAWACEFAGSAYGEAFGRALSDELARPQFYAARWQRLLDAIPKLGSARFAAAKALLAVSRSRIEAWGPAQATIAKLLPELERAASDYALHCALRSTVASDPDEQDLVAEIVSRELGPEASASLLGSVHRAIVTTPSLAERVRPRLLALAQRADDAGLEALRILGHLGVCDAELNRRYIDLVNGWTDFSNHGLERFPCWRAHDEETLAAFAAATEQFKSSWQLEQRLQFAGLTDARTSPLAEHFLSEVKNRGSGAWLVREGFRAVFPLEPDDRPAGRVNQLALRIAGLKSECRDFSAEESELGRILLAPYGKEGAGGYDDQVQWGLFHARELGLHSDEIVRAAMKYLRLEFPEGFDVHRDAAAAYFDTARLTLDEEIEMRTLLSWNAPDSRRWWGIDIVSPSVSGPLHGVLAIELVPRIRLAIYSGNVKALDDLVQITPLVPRDEDYLLAVLARGTAETRGWAIDLVARRGLDTARLRSAVRDRAHDLDRSVRIAGKHLIADRGW